MFLRRTAPVERSLHPFKLCLDVGEFSRLLLDTKALLEIGRCGLFLASPFHET